MYRRPKFLEILLDIRQEMARDADYDVDLFAEMVRSGRKAGPRMLHSLADSSAAESSGIRGPKRVPARRKLANKR